MNKRTAIAKGVMERASFIHEKAVALDHMDHLSAADVARAPGAILTQREQLRNLIGVARKELQRLEELCRE